MKKILHIQLLPLLSGVQNFSLHLLEGLPGDEFEIWVASKPGGEFVDVVLQRGYKYVPLRFLRHPISPLDLAAFAEMLLLMKRQRFDIVHTNSSKTGLLGRVAATLCKVPFILHTAHGTAFQEGQSWLKKRFFMAVEGLGNLFCHKVAFVNDSDREKCVRLGLLPPEKAITINNALPPSQAEKLASIADSRRFDPDRKDFVIGSTLRFSQQKNVVNLTAAACRACKKAPRLRFILLGDGEYLGLCRQIVRTHSLNGRVLLPGWDADVSKWLGIFDAFILYSRWEAQPFSIIEAMHAGLPVIGSRIPSISELVDPGSGWLVPLDDQSALIETLVSISGKPEEAFARGNYARERVREICDYPKMVDSYLELYCHPEPGQEEEG